MNQAPMAAPAATRALAWLRANELPSGGIRVSAESAKAYPEITGYLIPTLHEYGEHAMAGRFARWLAGVQAPEGSFGDPDLGVARVFDSAQVLRGLLDQGARDSDALAAAKRCAQWLMSRMLENGRRGFANNYEGLIPETVLLYALAPLRQAAKVFGEAGWLSPIEACMEHYLARDDLLKHETLTHFLGYELDALIELGLADKGKKTLVWLAESLRPDGMLPARAGANWACMPGQAQVALCWLKAGMFEPAQAALGWMERQQTATGGFEGSTGPGADYFTGREISWSVKFYLDAQRLLVARFMDRMASAFPSELAPSDGRLQAVLAAVAPGARVLEAGCGKGRFLRAIKAARHASVAGADIAPALLAEAGPGIETVLAPMENLPFADAEFDTVFSVEALEHSPNAPAAVTEMARVLKPGGTLLIIDKQASHWGRMECPSWERWPGAEELRGLLSRHGDTVSAEPVAYDGRDDGLMLAWSARKRAETAGLQRLLVIGEDKFSDLADKGLSGSFMSRYYNPDGVAREVFLLQLHGDNAPWPGLGHTRVEMPPDPALEAWRFAVLSEQPNETLDAELFLRGYPGLSGAWLEKLRALNPDAVRAYAPRFSGWLACEIGRALNIPVVVSVHNTRGLAAPALKRADAIMCVSDEVARKCIEIGADSARVVTVPNRVDRELFAPQVAPAADAPEGSPRLLCVARDSEQKNLDRLLAACELVRRKHPGLVLVHAGASTRDWSRWPFVRHVYSIPNPEMPGWLRWADWFVLPSLWEGFGIVYAEALACGVPCIAANRAPMNEIVRDGICGLTCDPESVEAIAATIERGISEPGLRSRLAANARAASEPFDIRAVEAREASLYRWVAAPRRPLVSVVLPTFNRRALIEGAIRNVLAQDYANLELIVVNDGSGDGTRELLDKLQRELNDPRLRVIHKENAGLPRALNTGFEAARGEFLSWTSDDNAFRPGAIRSLVRELELDSGAALVFADYQIINEQGARGQAVTTGPIEELPRRNVIGACFMYRREVAAKAGAYNPDVELAEDYDYWLRLAQIGRLSHLNRVLYDYGDTPDSLTRLRALEVTEAASRVLAAQRMDAQGRRALHDHLSLLAGQLKERGLALRSLSTALSMIAKFPLSKTGYCAAARALTPRGLLRATRRLRGLDGR